MQVHARRHFAPLLALALVACAAAGARAASPIAIPPGRAVAEIGGVWKLRFGDDPAWAAPDYDDSAWAEASVPGSWADGGFEGRTGAAWYRVAIDLPAGYPTGNLAASIRTADFSSFEVYAGGTRVGGRGAMPPSPRVGAPATVVCPVPASAVDGRGRLALAVRVWQAPETAGTPYGRGGIDAMPLVGDADALAAVARADEHRDDGAQLPLLVFVAVCLVVGLYHLQLFRRRRERFEYLWFGLLAVLMAGNIFAVSRWVFALGAGPLEARRAVDFSTHAIMAVGIQFMRVVLGTPIGRLMRGYQVANAAAALALLLLPGMHFALLSQRWRVASLIPGMVGLLALLVREAWGGNAEAKTMSFGFAWMLALQVLHVLKLLYFPALPFLPPWGFLGLVFAMAVSLANRFSRVHDELDSLNRDLEEKVALRTAELAESERRALEANRAKSTFLASMSHELRTPLNAVLGFAQLMERDRGRGPGDRESLRVIRRSGEHLLGLINDVLSLSKIEAGKLTVEARPFDARRMLGGVEAMVRARAEAAGLELVLEVDPALPAGVEGDEGKLRQVLVNLLGNAVKFTKRGRVTLRAGWADGRGRFEVEDTGPGIAPGELATLFEAFAQTESGRVSKEGTGLGLAISRQMVRLMGGDIRVASEEGRGSTFGFDVDLPRAAPRGPEREPRRVVGLAGPGPAPRLLVVDDVPENRALLVRLLTVVGFEVRDAANGAEAVDVWRAWRPDLVFMDMRMPVMDGKEAARRIRALEAGAGGRRTVIAALTASAFEHEREEVLAEGVDDFVTKPFREETIFERLAEHLGTRYVYEDEGAEGESAAAHAASGGALTPERIAALPAGDVARLHSALVAGDVGEATAVVERMRPADGELADELALALRRFEFEELLALTERVEPSA